MQNLTAVAGVVLGALLVTGCAAQDPAASPAPRPTSTPVFASDDEALAAAEAAYAEYVKVADQIFIDGGANPERLEEVATGEFLGESLRDFTNLQDDGIRSTGGTSFDQLQVQQLEEIDGELTVTAYLCEDVSLVDVFDNDGNSIVSPTRPDRTRLLVTFSYSSQRLSVSSREPWGEQC